MTLQRAPVAEPQGGAGPRPDRVVGVGGPQLLELGSGQVADPDRDAGQARADHVVDQPGGLGEVAAVRERQVQRHALQAAAAGGGGDVPQLAGRHAVPAHARHPLQHVARAGLALEEGGQVVRPADGVDDPVVQGGVEVGGERSPGGEHQQPAVVAGGQVGQLGVGADGDGVDPQPGRLARQPAEGEAVAVALAHRHQARVGVEHRAQVGAPPVAVDGQGQAHRAPSVRCLSAGSCRGRRPCRAAG